MPLPLSYSVRSLFARRLRTGLTVGVIALVVVATTLFLGLISSLQRTLRTTGDPRNLIVMRKGSSNDGSSQLQLQALQDIRFFDGIARHTPEGYGFQRRAAEVGFKEAVRDRDEPYGEAQSPR